MSNTDEKFISEYISDVMMGDPKITFFNAKFKPFKSFGYVDPAQDPAYDYYTVEEMKRKGWMIIPDPDPDKTLMSAVTPQGDFIHIPRAGSRIVSTIGLDFLPDGRIRWKKFE